MYVTLYVHSISFYCIPAFILGLSCCNEDIAMALVKASTPTRQLQKLSYDPGVVVYMEIEALEGMGDDSSNDNT